MEKHFSNKIINQQIPINFAIDDLNICLKIFNYQHFHIINLNFINILHINNHMAVLYFLSNTKKKAKKTKEQEDRFCRISKRLRK